MCGFGLQLGVNKIHFQIHLSIKCELFFYMQSDYMITCKLLVIIVKTWQYCHGQTSTLPTEQLYYIVKKYIVYNTQPYLKDNNSLQVEWNDTILS